MPVIFDTEKIRLITLFENLTGASVKDCLMENNIVYFVIDEGEIGKAIGKNGSSVKNVESLIKKDVKIFEFSSDLDRFIRNLIPQVTSVKVRNDSGRTTIEIWVDKKDKAIVIGRDEKNLKLYRELLQRSHDINDITVR